VQDKPKPADRQEFGRPATGGKKIVAVALNLAVQWHDAQAVSYMLTVDGKTFSILTVTPSYRWFEKLPDSFQFGAMDIPAAVSKVAWDECGPLTVKLATDAALELLRLADSEREKITALLTRAGEELAKRSVPHNPRESEGKVDGQ
jgi:hypothetical protein